MVRYSALCIRKSASKKWCGILKYKDATGKWKQVTKTSQQRLKRDARAELEKWEEEMRKAAESYPDASPQEHKKKSDNTIANVCLSYLDYQFKMGELEKSTFSRQKTSLKIYVIPYIGDYIFTDIDRVVIEDWLTELAKRGLKQGTIHTAYAVLNKVYHYFCRVGELSHNPCEYVKTPKKGDPKVTYMDAPQARQLVSCRDADFQEGDVLWTAIGLALYGGLRRGEICGLRWYDVDFEGNRLNITSSIGIAEDENGTFTYTKGPKNKTSTRTFPMIPALAEVLKKRYEKVARDYGAVVGTWFVIGDTINYKPPTTLATEFGRFIRRHDIRDHFGKYVTLHTLRHNLATVAVKSNEVDIASLAQLMGHASKAMTLDTYSSATPDAMELAAKNLGATLNFEQEREN